LVNTIHQVIWPIPVPSAHTIRDHFEPERNESVKERAEAGGPSAATVRQPASCHFMQRNLSGMLFCILQVPISTRGFAFAPPFHR